MGIKYSKKKRTLLKIYFLFHSYSPAVQSAFIRAKEDEKIDGWRLRKRSPKVINASHSWPVGRREDSREEKRREEGSLIKRWIRGHGAKAYRFPSLRALCGDFKSFSIREGYYFRPKQSFSSIRF